MFTGIVEEVGRVTTVASGRITIGAQRVRQGLRVGDSIAVNGACLTVVSLEESAFAMDVTPETLRRTNLGALRGGDPVDLERALAVGDRLGGHMVQGHVEGTARVVAARPEGDSVLMGFQVPFELGRYIVGKGFVAVDGVSLTVVECGPSSFTVSVIPYTQENTVLGLRRVGDVVNLETDIVARYVERLLPERSA